ncbi:DivIVA domain-containing protein [Sphaerimonospora sp. CA-214678]|uniref:DivIVA domain-containing protein n=1 Tax=Sphaerimonospora sp. CA-214678 TaxID=3240029 RepID=UPI003D91BE4A
MGQGHGQGYGSTGVAESEPSLRPRPDSYAVAGFLSPAAVRNQVFTVVRLREGYDLAEVDRFLGLVEITLTRLLRENEELRTARSQQEPPLSGENAVRIVEIVQEAADRTITMAHQEAQAILADARERAASLREEIRDCRDATLERRIESLHAFVAGFGSQLKESLDGQLNRLHNLLDGLQDPDGCETGAMQSAGSRDAALPEG